MSALAPVIELMPNPDDTSAEEARHAPDALETLLDEVRHDAGEDPEGYLEHGDVPAGGE